MDPLSAGITAGGGLLGNIFGSLFSANQQKKENERNRQFAHNEAELSYERQKSLMNMEASYNSPANQRRLMEEAGYNPNALFGGSYNGTVSSASSAAQATPGGQSSLPGVQMDLSGVAALITAQSNAKKADAETKFYESQTIGTDIENQINEIRSSWWKDHGREMLDIGLDQADADRALTDAQRLLTNSSTSLNLDELGALRPREAANLAADTFLKESQTKLNEILAIDNVKERELKLKQYALELRVAGSVMALNYANANAANAQARLYNSQTSQNWLTYSQSLPGGLLYNKLANENNVTYWNSNLLKQKYNFVRDTYDSYRYAIISGLNRVSTRNSVWPALESVTGMLKLNPIIPSIPF